MSTKDSPRPKKKKEEKKKTKETKKRGKAGKDAADLSPGNEKKGPQILSPFDELTSVWTLPSRKEQRTLIGELFELPDGAGLCRDSILLDLAYLDLLFAHQAGFNMEQTKVFWIIMRTMQANLMEPHSSFEKTLDYFKRALLDNSIYHSYYAESITSRSPEPTRDNSSATLEAQENSDNGEEQSSGRPTASRSSAAKKANLAKVGKENSKAGKAGKEVAMPTGTPFSIPADDDDEPDRSAPNPARLFSAENTKQLTEYVVNGFLAHFRLYRCVINQHAFQPCKQVEVHTFRMETIVPERVTLDQAVATTNAEAGAPRDVESASPEREDLLDDERSDRQNSADASPTARKLHDEKSFNDPVFEMVDKHTREARAEMARMLEANNRMLEARLADALGDGSTGSTSRGSNKKGR